MKTPNSLSQPASIDLIKKQNTGLGEREPVRMGYDDDLGNIDLEDSKGGLPEQAFLPTSLEGSFRSSMGMSSSHPPNQNQSNELLEKQNQAKKTGKKKVKARAAGKVNYATPVMSDAPSQTLASEVYKPVKITNLAQASK